ncbi:Chemotaxis protein methyltransferase [Roseobacter fucihabitans]|uniref:Chemotaxis protein methyltransferase n=1 Tax=Roseobacter fucihabitans TaxID=1537242 RepID=A0ABZ2BUI2_9RHOB|nr:CheR family methyltransferase [Roseobacter litoralis]MBC6966796.1 Chemotaxis protein methyltransferase [Roseobacter litoralis]
MINRPNSNSEIDPKSFDTIAKLAYRESGLILAVEKTSMIQSRLRHRLKELELPNFELYTDYVCSEQGSVERKHMISALTTNVSHFFREQHHFDILQKQVRETLLPRLQAGDKVRIWSAGCSNGQEALSIAMSLLEISSDIEKLDVKILATDIDGEVVRFATNALYPERFVSGVPSMLLDKYFTEELTKTERVYLAKANLRSLISFKELNLLANWPMNRKMDIIFCRNVVIYFDQKTQNDLWPRFRQLIDDEGLLFLGHSERIPEPEKVGFQTSGPTAYKPIC